MDINLINTVDQEYFGPEGYFAIHKSEITFEDNKTLEVTCDLDTKMDIEVIQDMLKVELDKQIVIIKVRK